MSDKKKSKPKEKSKPKKPTPKHVVATIHFGEKGEPVKVLTRFSDGSLEILDAPKAH